jgi:predicted phosphodiesterase
MKPIRAGFRRFLTLAIAIAVAGALVCAAPAFSAPAYADEGFSFIFFTDMHYNKSQPSHWFVNQFKKQNIVSGVDFAVVGGDLIDNYQGSVEKGSYSLGALLFDLDGLGIPYYAVAGNNDDDADSYMAADWVAATYGGGNRWYRADIDSKDVTIIGLYTGDNRTFEYGTQLPWLENELKKTLNKYVIVVSHKPWKSAGNTVFVDDFEKLDNLLAKYCTGKHVMILSGHTHVDDLGTTAKGFPYYVCGDLKWTDLEYLKITAQGGAAPVVEFKKLGTVIPRSPGEVYVPPAVPDPNPEQQTSPSGVTEPKTTPSGVTEKKPVPAPASATTAGGVSARPVVGAAGTPKARIAGKSIVRVNGKKTGQYKYKVRLSWKKASGAVSGYRLYYATNSKFKSRKSVRIKGAGTLKKTITVKTSKRYLYAKVRAYKTKGGKTYYGKLSKVRKLKLR